MLGELLALLHCQHLRLQGTKEEVHWVLDPTGRRGL